MKRTNTVRWSFTLSCTSDDIALFEKVMSYLKRNHFSCTRADALRYVVGCGREQALKEISDDDGKSEQQHT